LTKNIKITHQNGHKQQPKGMFYERNLTNLTKMAKLNKKKVRNAIPGSMGIYAIMAKKCEVSRSAMTQFLQKDRNKNILKEIEEEKEKLLDTTEIKLIELINEGDFQAIKLLLTTKGKNRGYTERQEVEQIGEPAIFNLIEKSNEEIKNEKARSKPGTRIDNKPEASANHKIS